MCQCASLKLSSSQLKVYGEPVSKKICKISEKLSKKWKPQKVCSLLHGVFMRVYLFEMLTLCSPIFSGQILQIPLRCPPGSPLLLQGFQPIFLSLYFFAFSSVGKHFFIKRRRPCRPLSRGTNFFKMKCKKLNHLLVPNPCPIYEFFPDFCH